MKRPAIIALFMSLILLIPGCGSNRLTVSRIAEPEYPIEARIKNIQGTVELGVQIGIEGQVLWAHGSGSSPILVEAAEKNAKKWVWGPFPPNFDFPFYHEISYVYKLEGKPAFVAIDPVSIRTRLPDQIEIVARPYQPDNELVPETAPPPAASQK